MKKRWSRRPIVSSYIISHFQQLREMRVDTVAVGAPFMTLYIAASAMCAKENSFQSSVLSVQFGGLGPFALAPSGAGPAGGPSSQRRRQVAQYMPPFGMYATITHAVPFPGYRCILAHLPRGRIHHKSRVEEERCRSTDASPLVEPDVRISRIRLSRRLSPLGSTAASRSP